MDRPRPSGIRSEVIVPVVQYRDEQIAVGGRTVEHAIDRAEEQTWSERLKPFNLPRRFRSKRADETLVQAQNRQRNRRHTVSNCAMGGVCHALALSVGPEVSHPHFGALS